MQRVQEILQELRGELRMQGLPFTPDGDARVATGNFPLDIQYTLSQELVRRLQRHALLVVPAQPDCQDYLDDLRLFANAAPDGSLPLHIAAFPHVERLPYETTAPAPEIRRDRLTALRLAAGWQRSRRPAVVVCPVRALMRRLPAPRRHRLAQRR